MTNAWHFWIFAITFDLHFDGIRRIFDTANLHRIYRSAKEVKIAFNSQATCRQTGVIAALEYLGVAAIAWEGIYNDRFYAWKTAARSPLQTRRAECACNDCRCESPRAREQEGAYNNCCYEGRECLKDLKRLCFAALSTRAQQRLLL
jgi:hypothetical protein